MVTRLCDQRRAEGAHDSGDVRADHFHSGDPLKRPEHSPVIEGSALNDNMPPQLRRIGQLDDLVQRVLDNGIGKPGRDVGDGRPLLLRLLYVGVHKHRAAGAEVNRVFGKQSLLGKAFRGVAQ